MTRLNPDPPDREPTVRQRVLYATEEFLGALGRTDLAETLAEMVRLDASDDFLILMSSFGIQRAVEERIIQNGPRQEEAWS